MVQYRRNYIEGGTYFFTVALRDRKAATLVERIDELREAVRSVKREKAFRIDAWRARVRSIRGRFRHCSSG
jgi:putative transposase